MPADRSVARCLLGALALGVAYGSSVVAVEEVGAQEVAADARIVSLGGSVTETVFALGAGHRIVAVDQSSLHPAEVRDLPQVGYFRTLSAEGVLSLEPDVVLASEGSGPPVVLEQLEAAGIEIVWVPDGSTPEAALDKIDVVSGALGLTERASALRDAVAGQIAQADALVASLEHRPRALFVWGHGGGGVRVAGSGTGGGEMLERSGTVNAAADIDGYQPITAEALLLAAPDVLVVPSSTLEGVGGIDGLLGFPGMSATPAGQTRSVVVVDLLAFVGFGPRVGAALMGAIHDLHPGVGSHDP